MNVYIALAEEPEFVLASASCKIIHRTWKRERPAWVLLLLLVLSVYVWMHLQERKAKEWHHQCVAALSLSNRRLGCVLNKSVFYREAQELAALSGTCQNQKTCWIRHERLDRSHISISITFCGLFSWNSALIRCFFLLTRYLFLCYV